MELILCCEIPRPLSLMENSHPSATRFAEAWTVTGTSMRPYLQAFCRRFWKRNPSRISFEITLGSGSRVIVAFLTN